MFQNWVTKGREREIEAFNYLICLPERWEGDGGEGGERQCRVCMEGSFHPERSSSGAALDSELRYKSSGFVRGRVGGSPGSMRRG